MVVERAESRQELQDVTLTDAVRIVIERKQKGKVKLLFQRKLYKDFYERPQESWDLPMDRTEDQAPEVIINYLILRLFGKDKVKSERIWQSEPHMVPFKNRPARFLVNAFYKVSGVRVANNNGDFKFLTPREAVLGEYDLPEETKEFLQEKYLGGDE